MTDTLWYPSTQDVVKIHDDIVSEYSETTPGIQNLGDVEFALEYIETGSFGEVPETIHEKVFYLLRLLVANHPFVDGNKRTALNTANVFYFLNGYRFDYDNEIRTILKQFGMDETAVDEDVVLEYLQEHTEEIDLAEAIEQWRSELVDYGFTKLANDSSDSNE
ncbi:type II toxin-antitoxin system death-on-curing family toxin [Haloprofundus halobius]|uniref:type II toxin-antitoxin system death-on-curing family toxin n=1 Tax=Haloprofundus halobius TaxID=2876194 RepID=UPI001CCF67B9|nr:type II toxin-antitoxin system death-on-curing family toxin [Haloprofundus halobius]